VRAAQFSRIRKRLASLGCTKTVLYIWRPEFLFALGDVAADLVVFHIDDEYSPIEGTVLPDEATLLKKADQVIVHSHPLMRTKGGINPHTALVPNGVDYSRYAAPCPEPADLAGVPYPRIGYAGHLKRQLNWKLIGELVRAHPEWSFVFVGGFRPHSEVKDIVEDLSSFTNVYLLGAKTVFELATYPQHFDCCIMPYDSAVHTNHYIYPMKLHEYLASGRPAVGTPIAVLKEFSHVVALATTAEEWATAIRYSLSNEANAPEKRRERQALARQHDWNVLALRVAEILAERLGEQIPQGVAGGEGKPLYNRAALQPGLNQRWPSAR
jgi:glycosyltransferase involved in cell wall biosynthesis